MRRPLPDLPALRLLQHNSVRIAPADRVPLPDDLRELIDHPLFQRLRGVRQLAFVSRVYPSATHTRFEHSIGVYHKVLYYIISLWHDQHSSFFRDEMTETDLSTLLVAALCHDLGQYPYSHVIEDVMRTGQGNIRTKELDHEHLTIRLLLDPHFRKKVAYTSEARDFATVVEKLGTSVERVVAVLKNEPNDLIDPVKCSVLHSIIDGPIDADKLDYLKRDSHHVGVLFGAQIDEPRFYQTLTTLVDKEYLQLGDKPQIALTRKGRVPAEQIMLARFHMFGEVYWHRMVRAHEAILAECIADLRSVHENFDEWFTSYVLDPLSTDEWFIELVKGVTGTSPPDKLVPISNASRVRIAKERAGQLLKSLDWRHGRNPMKTLVSISAETEGGFYNALQIIRDAPGADNVDTMRRLRSEFVNVINSRLGTKISIGDMIIDVPPKRKAANSVYIVDTDSLTRSGARKLSSEVKLWENFTEAFHNRTRRARVFCSSSTLSLLRSGREESYSRIIASLLRETSMVMAQEISGQLELELEKKPG